MTHRHFKLSQMDLILFHLSSCMKPSLIQVKLAEILMTLVSFTPLYIQSQVYFQRASVHSCISIPTGTRHS